VKVFSLPPHENWICDRFLQEWNEYNPDIVTDDLDEADINWVLAGWQWNRIPQQYLQSKKTVLTVHHIVPEKFTEQKRGEFLFRDQFVNWYHVPCAATKEQIREYTDKPVFIQPFWANQHMWYEMNNKSELREELGLPTDAYIVGSFQRDTEGHDLISPKLEKGPDQLVDILERISNKNADSKLFVALAGPRRQYVISNLRRLGIEYKSFDFIEFDTLNKLYNCLDLYIVSSRHEGGPQSIIECGLTKTPIISTKVGLAPIILGECNMYDTPENYESAFEANKNLDIIYNNVMKYSIPDGFKPFREFFEKIKG
jgi:glycosyltransferase involved in cell wall biosynthesis